MLTGLAWKITLPLASVAVGAREVHSVLPVALMAPDVNAEARLAVPLAVELEQPAKRSDVGQHAWRERGLRERLDPADGLVACGDVDAGVAVVHQKSSFPINVRVSSRTGEFSGESQ